MPRRRGAVVIGVNKTGGLPVLESSVAGAEALANWLASEGFEVKTITDAQGPVTPQQIAAAIDTFVAPGNYHQLVIYFSGHGYWKNDAELWLLTDAPTDANAAVSWAETAEFAKDCGIPNVVMISDACRSIPNTPRALKIRGSIVFPNEDVQRTRAKVDKFMAAATGTAAYEIPIKDAGRKENVFTHCFLRAFANPDQDMVRDVNEDGQVIKVVPNRRLGKYLQREVAALLANSNVQLNQAPDAEVLSDDDVYIGRVTTAPRSVGVIDQDAAEGHLRPESFGLDDWDYDREPPIARRFLGWQQKEEPPEPVVVDLRDVAAMAFERALEKPLLASLDEMQAIEQLAKSSGFNDAVAQAKTISEVGHFETETGFAIIGAGVTMAIVANGESPIIREHGDGKKPGVVRIERHLAPACTVVIEFSNGRGAALAALQGFIGHVLVEGDRIVNVSYVPSDNSVRWQDYLDRRQRVDRLRAAAAAAVRLGVFRLDDKQKAGELAEHIRVFKGLDPSLGLYAAYAYSEADRREDIDSILTYMRQDLGADLFDVAMLGRKITNKQPNAYPIAPFCPMLTQGWNLLRARGIALPEVLDQAQDELEPSLWTTFKPARTRLIIDAIRRGEIK